jgi:RNA polymerase sigma-70 factor (ECF subfamily)
VYGTNNNNTREKVHKKFLSELLNSFICNNDSFTIIFAITINPLDHQTMTISTFGQLFQEHSPNLQAFALQLTRDKNDAEDLFQDTAYKAMRYRHLYQPKTNLQAWMMTIMRNTFINEWRKRKRKQQIAELQIPGVTLTQTTATRNDGESKVTMQELMKTMDQLEEGLSKPFLMAFRGYKYEEIANEMNLPLGTIKSRIHQARKLLRASISRHYQTNSLLELLR